MPAAAETRAGEMLPLALSILSDASTKIDGTPLRLTILKFVCEDDLLAVYCTSKAFNQSIAQSCMI